MLHILILKMFEGIKSYMMTPRFKPLVDSVDSVMRDGQYSIVIEKYSCTWSNLMVRHNEDAVGEFQILPAN